MYAKQSEKSKVVSFILVVVFITDIHIRKKQQEAEVRFNMKMTDNKQSISVN